MQRTLGQRPADLKHENQSAILRYVYRNDPTTKPEITKAVGLSKPAASSLVDELVQAGFLRPVGIGSSTTQGGKRPVLYSFNRQYGSILSLSLGTESMECVLFDAGIQVLFRKQHKYRQGTVERILEGISGVIETMLHEAAQRKCNVLGIGISLPGIVSHQGTFINAIHMKGWKDVALGVYLSRQFDVPVWIDNECRNMILAENWFGVGQNLQSFITIKTRDGLGTGVMLDGRIYKGMDNSGGEFGHTTINMDGKRCYCGNWGCWELYASEPQFLKMVGNELLKEWSNEDSELTDKIKQQGKLELSDISSLYNKGNELIDNLVERYAFYLGVGIVNLVNTFNPELIILSRDLKQFGAAFLRKVEAVVQNRALPQPAQRVRIRFSKLGEDATVIGAATLVLRELMDGYFLYPQNLSDEISKYT